MLTTLAIANYRSLRDVVLPLGRLNLVTGPNGSGKSNLYRALRLLADTASGSATASIAREGGLESVLWAGPEQFTRAQRSGEAPIEGAAKRSARVSLRLVFVADELGYAIDLGLPTPVPRTLFNHDPEIKREVIWHGDTCHERSALIDRRGSVIRARDDAGRWQTIESRLPAWDSLLAQHADPANRFVPGVSTITSVLTPRHRPGSPRSARARRCWTTPVVILRRRGRPSSRSGTPKPSPPRWMTHSPAPG